MKAVTYVSRHEVSLADIPAPDIQDPRDALVRITSTALCGSDLHMYDGRVPPSPGMVLGHEPLGVVEEVGSAVRLIKRGQRVVLPAHPYCGVCVECAEGKSAQCLTMRPGHAGAAWGYVGKGGYQGAQAEYLRVSIADANAIPLPGEPGDTQEDDFVMLADAMVTGWHACDLANLQPADTVAVFGAGPIGLVTVMSAVARGASQVFAVDHVSERLRMAEALGAVAIDFRQGDPVAQIKEERKRRGMPPGESVLDGVDVGIDAVGFQAVDRSHPDTENPAQVIQDLSRLINPGGSLSITGVFVAKDSRPSIPSAANGMISIPWGTLFDKGVRVGLGRTNDRLYVRRMRDRVLAGRIHPGKIVTHHAALSRAPGLYRGFALRQDGIIKVVFRP